MLRSLQNSTSAPEESGASSSTLHSDAPPSYDDVMSGRVGSVSVIPATPITPAPMHVEPMGIEGATAHVTPLAQMHVADVQPEDMDVVEPDAYLADDEVVDITKNRGFRDAALGMYSENRVKELMQQIASYRYLPYASTSHNPDLKKIEGAAKCLLGSFTCEMHSYIYETKLVWERKTLRDFGHKVPISQGLLNSHVTNYALKTALHFTHTFFNGSREHYEGFFHDAKKGYERRCMALNTCIAHCKGILKPDDRTPAIYKDATQTAWVRENRANEIFLSEVIEALEIAQRTYSEEAYKIAVASFNF